MNVLWVKSGGVLPLDAGGKIRSFSIACELARRHKVTLFTFYAALTPDPHLLLKAPFSHVECVPLDLPGRGEPRDLLEYAANAFTGLPYQMRKYGRPHVRQRLGELLRGNHYDALVCDFLVSAAVVPWDKRIPSVIFTHNVEAAIWRRHVLVNPNLLWKLVACREYRTIARAERRFLKLANHVLAVSDQDRQAFLEFLPAEKVTTIPTGVDSEYFQPRPFPARNTLLVFTGSMDWIPNEDAIVFFCAEILPLIQRRIPDVKLLVVGKNPTRKLLVLSERNSSLRVTGAVDDIRPHVLEAAIYVVPLRIGGGTRIKIFEAMAMGMPVVSTTIGAEGLPVEHGKTIVLADSPQDFADSTVDLLLNPARADRIGRQARTLVKDRYGWSAVTNVLENVLNKVTGKAPECISVGPDS